MAVGVDYVIRVIDRATSAMRRVTNNFEGINRAAKKSERSFQLANHMNQAADAVDASSRKMASALKGPIDTFSTFEDSMGRVRAVTFKGIMNPADKVLLKEMEAEARKLGATTRFSASQAADAMVNLATGGFTAREQIAALPGVLDLAAAGKVEMSQAADIGVTALRGFGLEAEKSGRVVDILANTFTTSNTTITDLGDALKYVAPIAKATGQDFERTAAMLGSLGDVGIRGSQAGTVLRQMLSRLAAPQGRRARKAVEFLGIDFKDKDGNLRPVDDLLNEINTVMDAKFGKGKNAADRAALLKALFGQEALAGAQALIESAGSGKLGKAIEANYASMGVGAKIAADMNATTVGAALELNSAYEELQLTLAEGVMPTVLDLTKAGSANLGTLTKWAAKHETLVKVSFSLLGALSAIGLVLAPVIRGVAALTAASGMATKAWGYAKDAARIFRLGIVAIGRTAWVTRALQAMAAGVRIVTAALISNPIVAAIAAVVAIGVVLYTQWDRIGPWFAAMWDKLPGPVQSAIRLITAPIRILIAAGGKLIELTGRLATWVGGKFTAMSARVVAAMSDTEGPIGMLVVGAGKLRTAWGEFEVFFVGMWDGAQAKAAEVVAWVDEKLAKLGGSIEDFERSLPEWVTGREREVAGSALARARSVAAAAADGRSPSERAAEARAAARELLGKIAITVDRNGNVESVRTDAPSGLELPVAGVM